MTDQTDTHDLLPPAESAPIVKQADAPLATMGDVQPIDIQALFKCAIGKGLEGAETMKILYELHKDMEKQRAARDYAAAMAQFHVDCPPILRTRENPQFKVTRDGVSKASKFADLDEILKTIRQPAALNGLSPNWTKEVVTEKTLTLECVVTHRSGHKESSGPVTFPLQAGAGQVTSKASPQQVYNSVRTYARRASLTCVFGLSSSDDDDGAGGKPKGEPITEEQATKLRNFMMDIQQHFGRFFAHFSAGLSEPITDVTEFPAARYEEAMGMLETKRQQQEKPNG